MPQQHAQESTSCTCLGDGNIAVFDAHVLAKYWDCWVTLPNSHYVPEPFIFEAKVMEPLQDGRFGHIDCFQWPQLYSERYAWSGCIPQKVAYQDDPTWRWLWWDMTNMLEDFVLERGSMFRVGRVHPDKWKKLETICDQLDERLQNWTQVIPHYDGPVKVVAWMRSCRHALMCLKQLPFTFCNTLLILTLFQRLSLDIFGMLEYLGSTIPCPDKSMDAIDCWMGTITTNPEICQHIFDSCIPIWLVWKPHTVPKDLKVHKSVDITCPEGIITDLEVFKQSRQSPVIGLKQFAPPPWLDPRAVTAGENFVATRSEAIPSTSRSSASTASTTAPSGVQSSSTGVVRMERTKQHREPYPQAGSKQQTKASITLNAKLWQDLDDPAIPPSIYAWHVALQNVTKDPKRVHPNAPKIAYFFPHLALFVRGESSKCKLRYLRNWLGSRVGWITCLTASDVSPVIPHTWRAFLNTIPDQISSTFSGNKVHEAANLFGPELVKVQLDAPSHMQFRDITLSLVDLGTIDTATKSKILWDLYEHNFWFELVALDRMLVPNKWSSQQSERLDQICQINSELTMYAKPFPNRNQGLGSQEPRTKLKYVERFCALLASWQGFPSDIAEPLLPSAPGTRVWAVEKKLALFYVQSFFDNFGHPPIVPHLIPNNPPQALSGFRTLSTHAMHGSSPPKASIYLEHESPLLDPLMDQLLISEDPFSPSRNAQKKMKQWQWWLSTTIPSLIEPYLAY
ncbi:hypothetical protein EDC04DRAFT_2893586 [Pisolithus marmoratus]|nr:hypothetical protein EDC04DRAFT_2893586 [Pisolithus marmoratus]